MRTSLCSTTCSNTEIRHVVADTFLTGKKSEALCPVIYNSAVGCWVDFVVMRMRECKLKVHCYRSNL